MAALGCLVDRRWRGLVRFSLVASFAIPSHLCAQQNQLGKIIGDVRVVKGDFPVHPVLITLEMRGTPIGSAYCDGQGRFGFYNLVANEYRASIDDDAYEPASERTEVDPPTASTNFVQIALVPRAHAHKDPLPGPLEGST